MKLGKSHLSRKQLSNVYEQDPHHDPQCQQCIQWLERSTIDGLTYILRTLGVEQELYKAAGQYSLL